MRIIPRRLMPRRPEERSSMTLLEHIEELRKRLIFVIATVAVAAIAGWFAYDRVVRLLLEPASPYLKDITHGKLIFTGPLDAFTLHFKVAFYVGFVLASPFVLFHVWRFISPGLHKNERRYAIPFITSGLALFAAGAWFAWYTLPQALKWLIGPEITGPNVSPLLNAKNYISFAMLYHVAFGIAFELPVLLMILSLARIVSSKAMAKHRRSVFMGIAVASAVLTPSVDWFTMTALTVAMYVMYESCIWLSRLFKR